MRKVRHLLLIGICLLLFPLAVNADTIYDLNMDINIEKDGTANVIETWDVKANSGSEWYKQYKNLQNVEVKDFKVEMDGKALKEKTWNVDEGMSAKAGYYGINYISDGIELCFGKKDHKRHKFTLKYKLTNFVFNTEDAQVTYFTLFPNTDARSFKVTVTSFYDFPDTLEVWGYGYKGYAYVEDGKIKMSNEESTSLNNDYVVLLAKFPQSTFETENIHPEFLTFDDVLNRAKQGSHQYDYGSPDEYKFPFFNLIIFLFQILIYLFPFIIAIIAGVALSGPKYGYKDNKKINEDTAPTWREIPCNKDIYYANALIKVNDFGYKDTNILGAIILKWIKEDKIKIINEEKGVFNKETSSLDLTKENTFENSNEAELFSMMKSASGDGILEAKELEKWAKKNYSKFFNLFKNIVNKDIDKLKAEGHIYTRQNKEECKYKNVLDDTIYEESKKLFGLMKFFREFSNMQDKEAIEVKIWDEYLMFAYLFGVADRVASQLKKLYPEVIQDLEQRGMDIGTIVFIDNISTTSVRAASSARAAAESYSSGGGGFSSGGGGGGSFGGGGSMGGR